MIRVLVVDDSPTVRARLIEILQRDPGFEVVGEASDGRGAVELTHQLAPDVITLDIVMPDMTGLAATEQIMANRPTPILVVSSSFNRGGLFDMYDMLAAGAVDVLEKPTGADLDWELNFLGALRLVAKIKVLRHPRGRLGALGRVPSSSSTMAVAVPRSSPRAIELVALGASTGGPGALATVLGSIGPQFPLPIVMVLHIDAAFASGFAEWLGQQTGHVVKLARDGESLASFAGEVRLAPSDVHMIVQGGTLRLVGSARRNHCRPSIDVLFESLATELPGRVAACVLTGMGRDGASGLAAIRRSGGLTIAQDEATSVIYGMPREAALLGGVERTLPLPEIGSALEALRRGRS
jgi:two-component system chemotaxis response regulator CheB